MEDGASLERVRIAVWDWDAVEAGCEVGSQASLLGDEMGRISA